MPIEIVNGKWREETPHGRIICQIKTDGLHIQKITDLPEGQIIAHEVQVVSFQRICDLIEGQKNLILKTCCVCGKEFKPISRQKKCSGKCIAEFERVYRRNRRLNIPEIKSYMKAWYLRNPEKYAAYSRNRRLNRPEELAAYRRLYGLRNPEKIKSSNRKRVSEMPDHYISSNLRIPKSICPPQLIEAKRAQLKLIRLIKEKTQ